MNSDHSLEKLEQLEKTVSDNLAEAYGGLLKLSDERVKSKMSNNRIAALAREVEDMLKVMNLLKICSYRF